MAISRDALADYLDDLLQPAGFNDYGPNGLQVEGAEQIERVAFAVSATADSVARAVAWGADCLIVHHGLFWKFHGPRPIVGPFARRVGPLLRHGINLFGFHLPLDANLEVGNAAGIARRLGLEGVQPFGDHEGMPIGVSGSLPELPSAAALKETLRELLDHEVLLSSADETAQVRSLGIITGGANGAWVQAQAAGLDAYLTGEMSEHDWHEAQEGDIHMFAGGHNATESFGVQDLMAYLATDRDDLETVYFASSNPA